MLNSTVVIVIFQIVSSLDFAVNAMHFVITTNCHGELGFHSICIIPSLLEECLSSGLVVKKTILIWHGILTGLGTKKNRKW